MILTWIRIFIDCVWERLRVAPIGCRTLVDLPRVELPVLLADEEVAEETEDTPVSNEKIDSFFVFCFF